MTVGSGSASAVYRGRMSMVDLAGSERTKDAALAGRQASAVLSKVRPSSSYYEHGR